MCYFLSTEYFPGPSKKITVKPIKYNKAFSLDFKGSSKWTTNPATNIVTSGKKEKSFVLYPTITNIGAINSEKTASTSVGNSPIPIGFENVGFSENNLISFG